MGVLTAMRDAPPKAFENLLSLIPGRERVRPISVYTCQLCDEQRAMMREQHMMCDDA